MTLQIVSDIADLPDDASPKTRGSGALKVYQALKQDILDLSLPPGDPLDEAALSTRFALSRTPIREAMVRLVAEGLATTLPNRNTIVSTIDFAGLPAYLDALTLMYRVTTRGAALRRTDTDLAAIRTAQADFDAAVIRADPIAMIDTNRSFHLTISRAGGNRYYDDLFARLLNEGVRLMRLYYRAFDDRLPREYVAEHDAIIAAIAARDAETADALARQHAEQIVQQFQRFLLPEIGSKMPL